MENHDRPKPVETGDLVFYPTPAKRPTEEQVQPEPVLRVLALDPSPQASTLLMLSIDGDIPAFDVAIAVDRPSDRPRLLARLAMVQQRAIKAGTPILRVTADGPPADALHAKIRQILGFPEVGPVPPGVVAELALPVSLDTVHETTDSPVPYLTHAFPLLELGWAVGDCEGYLRSLRMNLPLDLRHLRGRSR